MTGSGCRRDPQGSLAHCRQAALPFLWLPDLAPCAAFRTSWCAGLASQKGTFVSRHIADFWQNSQSSRKFTLFLAPGREHEQDLAWVCFQLEKPFGGWGAVLRVGGGVAARSSGRVRAAEINIGWAGESSSCNYICPMTYNQHS